MVISFLGLFQSGAQTTTGNSHEYYISIVNVHSKADIRLIESRIPQQSGVLSITAFKNPVKMFVLKTSRPVTEAEFRGWMNFGAYQVKSFGEGDKARETAIFMTRKFN